MYNWLSRKGPKMFTQTDLDELRKRNAIRLAEAKEKLGTRWLLHPQNQVRIRTANKDSK